MRAAPLLGSSRVHARRDRFDLALEQIQLALELEPENGEYLFRMARLLPDVGRVDEARALLERLVLTSEPAWVSGWSAWALAGMAMSRDDHAEALARVNDAWVSGVAVGYYIRIGLLYPLAMLTAATGDESHLIEARKRYDLEFGGMPEGYRRYARILLEAVSPIGEPWFPYETSDAGVALVLEEAVDVAREGTRYGPEVAGIWWSLGLAKFLQGDATGALEAWDEQSKLAEEEDPSHWLARALAHHARDEPETAREFYDRAIAWMAVNPTEDIEHLEWFRAEAARVLGE